MIGVFAASRFKADDRVRLKDESEISLAQYAARRNLQILTAGDFNEKLREHGCPKQVTVQKVCRYAQHEEEVRESLNQIWNNPEDSRSVIAALNRENKELFEFEKQLET